MDPALGAHGDAPKDTRDAPAGSVEPTPAFGSECPRCDYPLAGLARRGLCPECGLFYVISPSDPVDPRPSSGAILLSLGWPVALPFVLIALSTRLPMEGAVLALVLLMLPYAFALANTFMLPSGFVHRFVPRGRWKSNDVATLFSFSKLAGCLWCLNALVAFSPLTCCCLTMIRW